LAGEIEVAYPDPGELGAPDAAIEQDEQREAITRGPGASEQQLVDVRREERRRLPRRPRAPDLRGGGEGDMASSSAQTQKVRITEVTFARVRACLIAQVSITSRRSSVETSRGSRSARRRLMRASTAS